MGLGELAELPRGKGRVCGGDVEWRIAVKPSVEDVFAQNEVLRFLTAALQDAENLNSSVEGIDGDAVGKRCPADVLEIMAVEH